MLAKILFLFLMIFFGLRTFVRRLGKSKSPSKPEEVLDQILMTMHAGRSFESAIREIADKEALHEPTLEKVFDFCRSHPSQSEKIISGFRKTLRLRSKLHEKQRAMTLQAKAQGIVSGALFVLLALTQWWLNDDFRNALGAVEGKVLFLCSTLLVCGGIKLVFVMARPGELEI